MAWFAWLLSVAAWSTTLAAPTASSPFTYYNLTTPLAAPCDLNTGPDGEIYASTFLANKLVYIDRTAANPALTEITIPYTKPQLPDSLLPATLQGVGACVVQPGNDGMVYLATGVRNQLAQYNPKTQQFKFFENDGGTAGNLQPFNDAWPAATGVSDVFPPTAAFEC